MFGAACQESLEMLHEKHPDKEPFTWRSRYNRIEEERGCAEHTQDAGVREGA